MPVSETALALMRRIDKLHHLPEPAMLRDLILPLSGMEVAMAKSKAERSSFPLRKKDQFSPTAMRA